MFILTKIVSYEEAPDTVRMCIMISQILNIFRNILKGYLSAVPINAAIAIVLILCTYISDKMISNVQPLSIVLLFLIVIILYKANIYLNKYIMSEYNNE